MAKEQVELALSDFQTEFFDEKYVERTNNGTKKEYISEKLQAGVETTNFYAQASAEGNVTVYEGKDSSGTEVVKGAIQEDASIKWDDVASGSLGGNGNSSEGGNGSGGEGGMNSEELASLKEKINALEANQKNLENENQELKNKMEKFENEIIVNKRVNLMNTPVEISTPMEDIYQNIDIPLKRKYREL